MTKTCEICGKIKEDSKVVQSPNLMFYCKVCVKKYDIVKCRSCSVWERREKMTIAADDCIVCSNCKRLLIYEFFHGD